MKTELIAQVRELATGWDEASIGRIVKNKRSYSLLDLAGREIARSRTIDSIAAAGRIWAQQQGWMHSCAYCGA